MRGGRAVLLTSLPAVAIIFLRQWFLNVSFFRSNTSNKDLPSISTPSSCVAACHCQRVLGLKGTWVQDWEFAANYGQHPQPFLVAPMRGLSRNIYKKFEPSNASLFRWETSWRWVDNSSSSMACQVDHTVSSSGVKVCALLQSLGIERVIFMGDSLTRQSYMALVNILGSQSVVASDSTSVHYLQCSSGNNNTLESSTIELILDDKIGGGRQDMSAPHVPLQFTNETLNMLGRGGRLLLVFNIGAHYQHLSFYQVDIDYLSQTLKGLSRPDDIYFFRTTVPGHYRCIPVAPRSEGAVKHGLSIVPYQSYHEYNFSAYDPFSWFNFEAYNTYAKTRLPMHMLDVYNMTLLRRDGHWGGMDCLHYRPMGPIDWWNHLLMTRLQSMIQCPMCQ